MRPAPSSSPDAGAPGAATPGVTPAMRQYLEAKQQYPDAILFFRMGDFYEMFYEDALAASRALELTLTSRSRDAQGTSIPMCGVPHHAVDGYLARLVRKGFRVAICDQVEDPRKAKGIVKREIVRVVSPGTLTDAAVPRCARAGVPAGHCAGRAPGRSRPGERRRRRDRRVAPRPHHGRILVRGILRSVRIPGAGGRADGAQTARDRRAGGLRRARDAGRRPGRKRRRMAGHACGALDLRVRERTPHAPPAAPDNRTRGIRSRRPAGGRLGRRRAAPLSARHAEGGSGTRARHRVQDLSRCTARRPSHAASSGSRRVAGQAPRRLAARTRSTAR